MTNPSYSEETIAAVATPPGEGGIAVVRISGPAAVSAAAALCKLDKGPLESAAPRTVHFGVIQDADGARVDQVLVTVFRAPHSYTGEDVVEISAHGSFIVTRKILEMLGRQGVRHAEPGEFTKRAFLNGKIDLMQAEAVLDLIRARSDKASAAALEQLSGSLSVKFRELRERLMLLYAHMEAFLDFPDEHLEIFEDDELGKKLEAAEKEIGQLAAGFKRGIKIREGVTGVLVGKPNAGKSSLFNALIARDKALVSEFPGTTRDALEESLEIGGYAVRMIDTAGLAGEIPNHPVDRLGMEKTRAAVREADFYLFVLDGACVPDENDRAIFQELDRAKPVIVLISKADLPLAVSREQIRGIIGEFPYLTVSAKTMSGIDGIERQITGIMEQGKTASGEGNQITRLRHFHALSDAEASLHRARQALGEHASLELVIFDLKLAVDKLRELVGEVVSEDLLDVIFMEFCIGK